MFKKLLYPLFLLSFAYFLFSSDDAKTIIAGIAIFLIGMVFMEDGFKLFSGGILEKVLEKSTNTVPKAIGMGFVSTAIVQSSSLISIIVISFLSAELISLAGAVGVIFGSNIGYYNYCMDSIRIRCKDKNSPLCDADAYFWCNIQIQ